MAERDPYKLPNMPGDRLYTLARTMENSLKRPPIGITQGGSSRRRERGAKVAATDGEVK